ncbi:methyl-accepting chemotaxis sensory transducer with Cache sensor [Desulfonauticus submarinus]|uniref:Methyl-accepting chemotaxis sensory transducer with Cache sensor n=1 Tax=Desulfonauticus submarinus TaxID=206665 RepID=A0A1H0DZ97_9BACT|nr:methyl-accepting chemotaxis protein [Desulfonauticus submarinus]SDN75356.1 methyl-accepting chemotaxis sensory transducer with Cache sensor [Desulfonauticus submarinus]
MRVSLKVKLLFLILGGVLFSGVISFGIFGYYIKDISLSSFQDSIQKYLNQFDRSINIFINESKANVDAITKFYLVKKIDDSLTSHIDTNEATKTIPREDDKLGQKIVLFMKAIQQSHPNYLDVYIGTKYGGFLLARVDTLPAHYDPRKRPWYKEAVQQAGKIIISKAYTSTTGDATISIAKTISKNGEILGVAAIDISLKLLTEMVKKAKIGHAGYMLLIQDDGVILADSKDPQNNFKKINEVKPIYSNLFQYDNTFKEVNIDGVNYYVQVKTSKIGWKFFVFIPESEIMQNVYNSITTATIYSGIVLVIIVAVILLVTQFNILKPLSKTVAFSQEIANGNLNAKISLKNRDELGDLANALNNMGERLKSMFRIDELRELTEVLTRSSGSMNEMSDEYAKRAESIASRANTVAVAAEEMSVNMSNVAQVMERSAESSNTVATASEEMSATIAEISNNTEKAKSMTTEAVGKAQNTSERVNNLGEAAKEISKVTETITAISSQTNLLALNATIEAARAGEAGKGFAVVANEIKELAQQTANATEEIRQKIDNIQKATEVTVEDIKDITQSISDIDSIISTIAAAVEEQSTTTRDIAENIGSVSQHIGEVNENVNQSSQVAGDIAKDISTINSEVNEMATSSALLKESAKELIALAQKLKQIISNFKV